MISRLTWNGTSWQKQDLVRGLPRSEENHSPNGIQLDPAATPSTSRWAASPTRVPPRTTSRCCPSTPCRPPSSRSTSAPSAAAPTTCPRWTTRPGPARPTRATRSAVTTARTRPSSSRRPGAGPRGRVPQPLRSRHHPGGRMYTIDNGANAGWGDVPKQEGRTGPAPTRSTSPGRPTTTACTSSPGPATTASQPDPRQQGEHLQPRQPAVAGGDGQPGRVRLP